MRISFHYLKMKIKTKLPKLRVSFDDVELMNSNAPCRPSSTPYTLKRMNRPLLKAQSTRSIICFSFLVFCLLVFVIATLKDSVATMWIKSYNRIFCYTSSKLYCYQQSETWTKIISRTVMNHFKKGNVRWSATIRSLIRATIPKEFASLVGITESDRSLWFESIASINRFI